MCKQDYTHMHVLSVEWAEQKLRDRRENRVKLQLNLCTLQENDLRLLLRCGQSQNNIFTHKNKQRDKRETRMKIQITSHRQSVENEALQIQRD